MQKRKLEGFFTNTYTDNDGFVDFFISCWIFNGRFYRRFYDAKKDELHKIKRISEREYMSEYEYHYNI